jgi:Ca2+-binding RTX toxin-like protein
MSVAVYTGTLLNDTFNLSSSTVGDVVYGDGLLAPSAGHGNNVITTGLGADTIYGGYGSDRVVAGAGDDLIYGYGAAGTSAGASNSYAALDLADYLDGRGGNDRIYGGGGNDTIVGGEGNDRLWGGSGSDRIYGGNGNDIISSGAGADKIWGGSGQDTFVYGYNPGSSEMSYDAQDGIDTIADFTPGADKINLQGYGITADALQVVDTAAGLELHFVAIYEDTQINLLGVHALQAGDIVFA